MKTSSDVASLINTEGPIHPRLGTACHDWTGYVDDWGYGRIPGPQGGIKVARILWEQRHGPKPDKRLYLRHKCDRPVCVNVEHLELGTAVDNMRDCVERGRLPRPPGERAGRAKMTDEAVTEARRRYRDENVRVGDLAREAGVAISSMARALNGTTYWHLPDPLPRRAELSVEAVNDIRTSQEPASVLAKKWGTSQKNISRLRRGERRKIESRRGETKVPEETRRAIQAEYVIDPIQSHRSLGRKYGLSGNVVGCIVRGELDKPQTPVEAPTGPRKKEPAKPLLLSDTDKAVLVERLRRECAVDPEGCLVYTGKKHSAGYGYLNYRGQSYLTHRLAYTLYVGEVPPRIHVLHRCGRGSAGCCDPRHLYLGTDKDNARDQIEHGVARNGAWPRVGTSIRVLGGTK